MSRQSKTLVSFTESRLGSAPESFEACLSEDEILAFVRGQLTPDRSDKVHAHLDCCVDCQRLTSEAAHALDLEPSSNNDSLSWNAVFQPGSIIANRYRIVRMLGHGGMGQVFEVHDTVLHERVALKTVTATHCDNAEAVYLLKAEVQLARRISHPNVCRIFDLGAHVLRPSGGEVSFLVMEYVDGECLGKKLRQHGALGLNIALPVAHELLQGLAAAHAAGILHRDFKCDNVMLHERRSGRVTAVILDFGLAKVLGETGCVVTTQSQQAQAMVGTVGYMAPEQIEGRPLTPASDIYSFGVVLFEMLTGRLPFEAETLAASAMSRLHRLPNPPSHYNEEIPDWLDAIVLKCLARYPSNRFASAEEVMIALGSHAEFSLKATRPSKRKARTRLQLRLAFTTCVAGLIIVAASYRNALQAKNPLPQRIAAEAASVDVPNPSPSSNPSTVVDNKPAPNPPNTKRIPNGKPPGNLQNRKRVPPSGPPMPSAAPTLAKPPGPTPKPPGDDGAPGDGPDWLD